MAQIIRCNVCRELKLDQYDFPFRWTSQRNKYYYEHTCRQCKNEAKRNYYRNNIDSINLQRANYRNKNREKINLRYRELYPLHAKRQRLYRASKKGHYKELSKKHYNNNKQYYLNRNSVRRSLKIEQTPINLSDYDKYRVDLIYITCSQLNSHFNGTMFEVDHIIPISKGGLHHPDNLQIILKDDNRSKGNKINYKLKFGYKFTV